MAISGDSSEESATHPSPSGVGSDRKSRRWSYEGRLNRITRGIAALGFSVEVVGVLVLAGAAAYDVAENRGRGNLLELVWQPGVQVISHLDVIRAIGFFAGAVGSVLVLLVAASTLWRSVVPSARRPSKLGRTAITAATVGNVIGVGLAIAVLAIREHDRSPDRFENPPSVAVPVILLLSFIVISLFSMDASLHRGVRPGKGMAAIGGVMALVVVATGASVSQLNVTSYRAEFPGSADVSVPVLLPLQAGFWRQTFVQHLASDQALFGACGDAMHCALWGYGFGHQVLGLTGEVTVTADGGRHWHSWLLPKPLISLPLWWFTPVCTGATCIVPLAPGGFYAMTVQPDGQITGQIVGTINFRLSGRASCPDATWCASITPAGLAPQDFVISSGFDMTPRIVPLPRLLSLAPTTTFSTSSLACPSPGVCVTAGHIGAQGGQRLSPAQRRALGIGQLVVAVTDNGGGTWTRAAFPAGVGADDPVQITCPDQRGCWAWTQSASEELLRSTDGGRSWHRVVAPSKAPIRAIACATDDSCVVMGFAGFNRAYRTADGGRQWQTVVAPSVTTRTLLWTSSCSVSGLCIASGFTESGPDRLKSPMLYLSQNAGETWQVAPLPVPREAGLQAVGS